jgi:hypothetical protein
MPPSFASDYRQSNVLASAWQRQSRDLRSMRGTGGVLVCSESCVFRLLSPENLLAISRAARVEERLWAVIHAERHGEKLSQRFLCRCAKGNSGKSRSQAVRQQTLTPSFEGSIPPAPTSEKAIAMTQRLDRTNRRLLVAIQLQKPVTNSGYRGAYDTKVKRASGWSIWTR